MIVADFRVFKNCCKDTDNFLNSLSDERKKCRAHLEKDGPAFNIRQPYLEFIPIFSPYLCK